MSTSVPERESVHASDLIRRMKLHGVQTLSDSELVRLVTRADVKGVSHLTETCLLTTLAGYSPDMISRDGDVTERQGASLAAAYEIGRRVQVKQFRAGDQVKKPQDIADRYIPLMRDLQHEEFWVIHLNKANVIIRHVVISKGGVSASVVDAHEVFRSAILDRAASVILLHNHPSGNPEPSREDIALTRALADAGAVLQLPVYDHLIVAMSQYTSFKERRLL